MCGFECWVQRLEMEQRLVSMEMGGFGDEFGKDRFGLGMKIGEMEFDRGDSERGRWVQRLEKWSLADKMVSRKYGFRDFFFLCWNGKEEKLSEM